MAFELLNEPSGTCLEAQLVFFIACCSFLQLSQRAWRQTCGKR